MCHVSVKSNSRARSAAYSSRTNCSRSYSASHPENAPISVAPRSHVGLYHIDDGIAHLVPRDHHARFAQQIVGGLLVLGVDQGRALDLHGVVERLHHTLLFFAAGASARHVPRMKTNRLPSGNVQRPCSEPSAPSLRSDVTLTLLRPSN